MPVYLVVFQVAKNNLQLSFHGPNLSALVKACNRETGTKEFLVFFILSKYFHTKFSADQ